MLIAEPDKKLDPKAVTLWRLQRLVRLVLFSGPLAVAVGVGAGTTLGFESGVVIAGGLIALNLLLAMTWPMLEYRYYRYEIRRQDLLVRHGVLFRRWSSIPLSRIQHVDTRQGPMERALGVTRLLVYTAAGMSADGSIPGLSERTAERIRDELSRRGGDDGV